MGQATYITHGSCDLGHGERPVTVLLPGGWPHERPMAAVYLLHGAGYDDRTHLGAEGVPGPLAAAVDGLVADGSLPPTMVVAAHWSDAGTDGSALRDVRMVPDVLRRLVAWSEGLFGRVCRDGRALTGFSMGATAVWQGLVICPELFSLYVPVGGDCWALGVSGGLGIPRETAYVIAAGAGSAGGPCRVSAWCGERDASLGAMEAQLAAMRAAPGPIDAGDLEVHLIANEGHTNVSFEAAVPRALRGWKIRSEHGPWPQLAHED